jgi:hypothetical protein
LLTQPPRPTPLGLVWVGVQDGVGASDWLAHESTCFPLAVFLPHFFTAESLQTRRGRPLGCIFCPSANTRQSHTHATTISNHPSAVAHAHAHAHVLVCSRFSCSTVTVVCEIARCKNPPPSFSLISTRNTQSHTQPLAELFLFSLSADKCRDSHNPRSLTLNPLQSYSSSLCQQTSVATHTTHAVSHSTPCRAILLLSVSRQVSRLTQPFATPSTHTRFQVAMAVAHVAVRQPLPAAKDVLGLEVRSTENR